MRLLSGVRKECFLKARMAMMAFIPLGPGMRCQEKKKKKKKKAGRIRYRYVQCRHLIGTGKCGVPSGFDWLDPS